MTKSAIIAGIMLSVHWPLNVGASEEDPVVIPFDFESKFDNGRYGQIVGDMIWKKLERKGGFILPESMMDVRDWCQRNKTQPGPDTDLEKMKTIVTKGFGANIAIWGKVERVKKSELDIYDLWIFVADFSEDSPRLMYKKQVRTKTVSEIPHLYVKAALEKLSGSEPETPKQPDPRIQLAWDGSPNLVQGNFEAGTKSPLGWDPLPRYVSWERDSNRTQSKESYVRFSFPRDIAATTGVLYYSAYFPIQEGATYRFQCRWRSSGSAAKVFIKCYDELGSTYTNPTKKSTTQRREVYRSQQNLKGRPDSWNIHTEDFTPKHTQYTPRWGRVMLYAYWPEGTVEWDDVIIKQIQPAPQRTSKIKRPSLESGVRTEEIKK